MKLRPLGGRDTQSRRPRRTLRSHRDGGVVPVKSRTVKQTHPFHRNEPKTVLLSDLIHNKNITRCLKSHKDVTVGSKCSLNSKVIKCVISNCVFPSSYSQLI